MADFYNDYRQIPLAVWRWRHFSPVEIACKHCGSILIDMDALDHLEMARVLYGRPITVASAYRCETRNKEIGGAEDSPHLRGTAFDIYPDRGGDLAEMLDACYAARPLGRGMGAGKIHFDWDVKLGKRAWYYGVNP